MKNLLYITLGGLLLVASLVVDAAQLKITVHDNQGAALKQAVVSLTPTSAAGFAAAKKQPLRKAELAQRNKQFDPHLIAVQKGAPVEFPNFDDIKHQVYSLSAIKQFDLVVKQGSVSKSVTFEKSGVIDVGCNVHDWMSGYIYVVDTPYFGVTDENGQLVLDLPDNETLNWQAWHPRLDAKESGSHGSLTLKANQDLMITLTQDLLPGYDQVDDLDEFDDY